MPSAAAAETATVTTSVTACTRNLCHQLAVLLGDVNGVAVCRLGRLAPLPVGALLPPPGRDVGPVRAVDDDPGGPGHRPGPGRGRHEVTVSSGVGPSEVPASNDRNLWMGLGGVSVKGRTFPG